LHRQPNAPGEQLLQHTVFDVSGFREARAEDGKLAVDIIEDFCDRLLFIERQRMPRRCSSSARAGVRPN
jgi:hypothetical protein